jgi:hypothetical protein
LLEKKLENIEQSTYYREVDWSPLNTGEWTGAQARYSKRWLTKGKGAHVLNPTH